MPKKRKSTGEDEFVLSDINSSGTEVYEKGGRVLRARETCMCPVCGMYFSTMEIHAHAQACLYIYCTFLIHFNVFWLSLHFLDHEAADVKKKKKGMSSSSSSLPTTPIMTPPLSKSDSGIGTPDKANITPPRPKIVVRWQHYDTIIPSSSFHPV